MNKSAEGTVFLRRIFLSAVTTLVLVLVVILVVVLILVLVAVLVVVLILVVHGRSLLSQMVRH